MKLSNAHANIRVITHCRIVSHLVGKKVILVFTNGVMKNVITPLVNPIVLSVILRPTSVSNILNEGQILLPDGHQQF